MKIGTDERLGAHKKGKGTTFARKSNSSLGRRGGRKKEIFRRKETNRLLVKCAAKPH